MSCILNYSPHDITDDLLVKFLLGETEPGENTMVGKWIAASKENEQYFTHFKLIWDNSKQMEAVSTLDENEAWLRFKARGSAECTYRGAGT